MSYNDDVKARSRRRILRSAGARFRRDGIAASGLAGILGDAGLTNGAFYAHFDSKDELVKETLLDTLGAQKRSFADSSKNGISIEDVIRLYLSARHRDDASLGCPTAALASEIARQSATIRDAFTSEFSDVIDWFAALLPGKGKKRRSRAIALYGMIIGALQLSRAVSDRKLADEILDDGIISALAFVRAVT